VSGRIVNERDVDRTVTRLESKRADMPLARIFLRPLIEYAFSEGTVNADGQIGIATAAIREDGSFDQPANAQGLAE
jgi:hypothetical protein